MNLQYCVKINVTVIPVKYGACIEWCCSKCPVHGVQYSDWQWYMYMYIQVPLPLPWYMYVHAYVHVPYGTCMYMYIAVLSGLNRGSLWLTCLYDMGWSYSQTKFQWCSTFSWHIHHVHGLIMGMSYRWGSTDCTLYSPLRPSIQMHDLKTEIVKRIIEHLFSLSCEIIKLFTIYGKLCDS